MSQLLLVGFGGAAGSILRYLCQRPLNTDGFPYGTLAVNIVGCLIIGILWAFFSRTNVQETTRLLLMTGFCGGFTTFSAFTYEGVQMLTQGRLIPFVLYTSISVIVGLVATFAGYKCFQ
ncbi:MAG: putative fluoride ion transporter CrcB [Flaviaesturariibacter sp.]|nr:putative fluoride ion transporter CrcB [Flaviaesturariibacter sp.]